MELARAKIALDNPLLPRPQRLEVDALVDTSVLFLCIPQHVAAQLGLNETSKKEIATTDGSKCLAPYVGPVEVRFKNRVGFTGALVMGDQILLGAIPMEDMDLVIHPKTRSIDVNPDSPNIACSIAK